jgi:hypothetical protein
LWIVIEKDPRKVRRAVFVKRLYVLFNSICDTITEITVEQVEQVVNPFRQDKDGGIHAGVVEGPGGYYFGIIDTLQEWTWRKKVENFVKTYFRMADRNGISSIQPDEYATRFWNRVVRDVFEYVDDKFEPIVDNPPRVQIKVAGGHSTHARIRASSIRPVHDHSNGYNPNHAGECLSVRFF